MGFRIHLFKEEPDRDIICSVCMGVLDNPVKDQCGHFFCADCLGPWLQKTGRCPISNQSIHSSIPSESLSQRINCLKIKCVECKKNFVPLNQRSEGCIDCVTRRISNRTSASDSFDRRFNQPHHSFQQEQKQKQKDKNSWGSWALAAGAVAAVALAATSATKNKTNRK
ncbi:RING finger protein 151-like isoform X1 [Panonychus citri]|uniref:RING finger protein 151-like isoform X1 n=1 Tax=Panonychus citri TaxID=50023 RepID=UPI002307CB96|nr:RING finger protein 151-like isoform X1 [Panonychus citri]